MPDRLLPRGGYVVSVDPEIGDINGGDVLIEGGTIAAVDKFIDVTDAEIIDVTGDVDVPGFVDTHRHTWETPIRGSAPNATLDDYFRYRARRLCSRVSTRRRLRRQLHGCAGVHQRRHHDAARLVTHTERSRPFRPGDTRAPRVGHPLGLRVRLSQYISRGLVVQQFAQDTGRREART